MKSFQIFFNSSCQGFHATLNLALGGNHWLTIPKILLGVAAIMLVAVFSTSSVQAQDFQQRQKRLLAQLDSMKRLIPGAFTVQQVETRAKIGKGYEALGIVDSALRYHQHNYLVSKDVGLENQLSVHSAINYARVLKRKGHFLEAVKVLDYVPDEKVDAHMIDLRMERYLLLSSCCISTGELLRAYENWYKASLIADSDLLPRTEAMFHFTKALILGVTQVNGLITFHLTNAVNIGNKGAVGRERVDHLLCLASAKMYGNMVQSRDSLLALARQAAFSTLDSSWIVDFLELEYRTVYYERNIPRAMIVSKQMLEAARKYKLRYLEGLAAMYVGREGPHEQRLLYMDTAIAIFRECGHLNSLKIALHERFDYYNSPQDHQQFVMANYLEHYKLVEHWEDQQKKVDYAFANHQLEQLESQLEAVNRAKASSFWFLTSLAVVTLGLVVALFIYRTQLNRHKRLMLNISQANQELATSLAATQDELGRWKEHKLTETHQQERAQLEDALEDAKSLAESQELVIHTIEQALRANPLLAKQLEKAEYSINQDAESRSWLQLMVLFEDQRPNFMKKLLKKAPELTPLDQKICAFLVMDLGTRTIAQMLNITEASLLNRRSVIRKKMGLGRDENLQTFLGKL